VIRPVRDNTNRLRAHLPLEQSTSAAPLLWSSARLHGSTLPGADEINRRILEAFAALTETDYTHRTHFFGGRYENLYLERTRVPELMQLLAYAEACAREILAFGDAPLRSGFWLNAQGPGQTTTEHTHDENDELLSGVYYVSVPPDSGDLILLDGCMRVHVTPAAGMFLFFPPNIPHRVERNRSPDARLSVAFNFGPEGPDNERLEP
jgi:hypothetical protein